VVEILLKNIAQEEGIVMQEMTREHIAAMIDVQQGSSCAAAKQVAIARISQDTL
jgi:hypothetical protein